MPGGLCHQRAEGLSKAVAETEAWCFVSRGECQAVIKLLTRAADFFRKRVDSEEGHYLRSAQPHHLLSQSLHPPCGDPHQRGSLNPGLVGRGLVRQKGVWGCSKSCGGGVSLGAGVPVTSKLGLHPRKPQTLLSIPGGEGGGREGRGALPSSTFPQKFLQQIPFCVSSRVCPRLEGAFD